MSKPVIFISYSHKDEPSSPGPNEVRWRSYVHTFLAPAANQGIVHVWSDDAIGGGRKWKAEITKKLDECDLLILLVSVNSLSSKVVDFEVQSIRRRQKRGDAVHLFPIVLSVFPAESVPWLMELNLRPQGGHPLEQMSFARRKEAMAAISDEVIGIVRKIQREKASRARRRRSVRSFPTAIRTRVVKPRHLRKIVDIAHLPETAYERLVGRDLPLSALSKAWRGSKTNVLSLVAEGGAGKSALLNEWLSRLQADEYPGADAVLGWSFYSQGSKERATSAEGFLDWALEKLAIKIGTTNVVAKGEAIADEIARRPILLALDGVEPLQHGPGPQLGQLKDMGVRSLLRRLAVLPSPTVRGLIVLTSRLPIQDIARWKSTTAKIINIERLSSQAGVILLRDNGAWGTDREMAAAVREFDGHPLALGLLATLIRETKLGDIRRRDHLAAWVQDEENARHGHAKRVMRSYEKEWLQSQPLLLSLLGVVGLFDHPATSDCLQALRSTPAIEGLTDQLSTVDSDTLARAVARLREVRLLAPMDETEKGGLDAHPLVREWFGEQLRRRNEAAWRAAHRRIYEHLRRSTEEGAAPTLESLAPLYQAVPHGCKAGLHQETLDSIYFDRICRRLPNGTPQLYALFKLGAIGSELAAISWFFERPYDKPIPTLSRDDQSWILSHAAYCLRSQGRFSEAVSAQRAALSMDVEDSSWENASINASHISQSELLVGQVSAAVATAVTAVSYADQAKRPFQVIVSRTAHAAALHAAGKREDAEYQFLDAEKRQRQWQPAFPVLYSVQGYRYYDLLIGRGYWEIVRERARQNLSWESPSDALHERALVRLLLGRANVGFALERVVQRVNFSQACDDVDEARERLDDAVDGLRSAGQVSYIPWGLIARAALFRSLGDWDRASRDLLEVEEIAASGPMRLFRCDVALERARIDCARVEAFAPLRGMLAGRNPARPQKLTKSRKLELKQEVKVNLQAAADHIKFCGYHRRGEELAELQAVLRGKRTFASLPPRV